MMEKTFHTGLYTKEAYQIIRSALELEFYNSRTPWLAYHGRFVPEFITSWIGGGDVMCLLHNFVTIADNGEICFTVKNYSNTKMPVTLKKLANAILRDQRNATDEALIGIRVIVDHLNGKTIDNIDPLFVKFIGHPLNPFQQAVLTEKRRALHEEITKWLETPDPIKLLPKDFMPNTFFRLVPWINKCIEKLFNEYLECLVV